jgi:GNAT superfamily N-acetyltransferase
MRCDFTIRSSRPDDLGAIIQLIPRLRAFGVDPIRSIEALDAGERGTIMRYFESAPKGSRLWVAEEARGSIVGVAYAEPAIDYFTRESHGHLGILAVAEQAEGSGAGRALLGIVEQWARDSGFRFLTLNVFARNTHARGFYERRGFSPDTLRYVKVISAGPK